ncbi:MAG: hypothetical protein AB8B50_16320 [Pirellulaceae bacterium]
MKAIQAEPIFSARAESLFWFVFISAVVGIFWPGLFLGQIPAFRDAYHFYFPQAVWQIECASQGEWFPMWNQFEGLGTSVPGQGSSALYYPPRILLLLPALLDSISAAQAFSLFIATHVVIAAVGVRWAASTVSACQSSCWLAGLSFGLSCPVLFQQFNLIYLCSAAWMGFALAAVLNLEQQTHLLRQTGWVTLWSISIAVMLLAGDPHTAVNSVLVSASLGTLLSWKRRDRRLALKLSASLAIGCIVAALITVPQWLPTLRWSQHCHRAGVSQIWPRLAKEPNLTPESLSDEPHLVNEHARLLTQLQQAKLAAPSVYEFSLSPWHVASLAFPTLGGQHLPSHSRWLDAWPAEGRMWIPSLFMGSATFLTLLLLGAKGRREFLLLGSICLVLSFGNYSPSWLLREASFSLGFDSLAGSLPSDRATALYEVLVKLVPGYSGFRYPAKWTTWFVALLCLSTAANAHKLAQPKQESRPRRKMIIAALSVSCIVFGGILATATWGTWFNSFQPLDPLLGRCEASSTSVSLFIAGGCSMVALLSWHLAAGRRHALRFVAAYTLAELSCFSLITSCFTPPPTIQVSPTTPNQETPLVWANLRYASLEDQTKNLSLVERQTQLQDQFLIGKLSVLGNKRSLAAVQSLEPVFAEKIRLSLNSLDNFSASQPDLDELLAALGITDRLAKSSVQHHAPDWVKVENAKPLCELIRLVELDTDSNIREWAWLSQSRLAVTIEASHPCVLLIRQFNDGGWRVEGVDKLREQALATKVQRSSVSHSVQEQGRYFVTNSAPTPFLEIRLPAGRHELAISRRWFW